MRTARHPTSRYRPVALALLGWLSACGKVPVPAEGQTDPTCPEPLDLAFVPASDADEAYICFGFERSDFDGVTLSGVRWSIAEGGGWLVHHAIVYAVAGDFPDGPVTCDGMPDGAVELHVWSPGGDDLALPSDTALELPSGTTRFAIQAHVVRVADTASEKSSARLCAGPSAPLHLAKLMGTGAPVPAIRPRHEESSAGTCALAGAVHLYSVWPHMHLIGKTIDVGLIGSDGLTTALVSVSPWDFHHQRTYPLAVDADAGDQISVGCSWDNPSDAYVLPGSKTTDEMCNAAFIAWPAEAARCE